MEIIRSFNAGICEVTLRGQFTFNDHSAFRDVIQQLSQPSVRQVVLHLGLVDFIDSAALGMLLLALDESEKQQKSLLLSGAVGQVKKMFDMARFNTLFQIV